MPYLSINHKKNSKVLAFLFFAGQRDCVSLEFLIAEKCMYVRLLLMVYMVFGHLLLDIHPDGVDILVSPSSSHSLTPFPHGRKTPYLVR
jgi:hypothetical protein